MAQWKEKTIKELGTFFSNNTFSRDCLNYESGKFQNVHYGDVLITFPDILDAASPLLPYVNDEQTVTSEVFIEDGDIIVADTAEDETVGKVCEIRNVGDRKIVSGLHTLWFRPNPNEFAPKYLSYLLNSFDCHKQLIRKAHGIKVLSINKGDFWKVNVKYPSLSEQQAIAGIISKVDQCIENVQKSIEATQKLKKSLMQNLLTGRMKPDGTMRKETDFWEHPKMGKVPNGWEVKRIKDCFIFYTNATYSRSMLSEEGYCRYIHYGDIHTKFDTFLDIQTTYLPSIKKEMVKHYELLKDGDLIIADTSEDYEGVAKCIEIKNVCNSRVISGLHTLILRQLSSDYVNGFIGYIFNEEKVRNHLLSLVTGIKVYSISKRSLRKLHISIPPKEEQEKIRELLDTNFQMINFSLEKMHSLQRLKKSLMQNLLTGQKRVDVAKINSLLESMN